MKRCEALKYASSALAEIIEEPLTARQEAEILLQYCLCLDKVQLCMESRQQLSPEEELTFRGLLKRRVGLEPVPYIMGQAEFFGLKFSVNPSVLIPRPESELLVEKVLAHIEEKYGSREVPLLIADIGTGCGCLAITLSLFLPRCKFLAIDISGEALNTARGNVLNYNLESKIELVQGDLLSACGGLSSLPDIIVANLPYISLEDYSNLSMKELKFEPAIALVGGQDGLSQVGRLLIQASEKLNKEGSLFLEVGKGQAAFVARRALELLGPAKVEIFRDLGDIERVVKVSLTPWRQERLCRNIQ